jgi:hypothetical protein
MTISRHLADLAAQDWAKAHAKGGDRKSDQSATLHFDSAASRAEASGAGERLFIG